MLNYTRLSRQPKAFRTMTGISLAEFERLYREFAPLWEQHEQVRLDRPRRQRAMGGGRPYRLDERTLLVMTLVWLHYYPTMEFLGSLFGVHKSAISRNSRRVVAVLQELGENSLWWNEPPERHQDRAIQKVLDDYPDLTSVLDVTEISLERPQDPEQQARHYSGKKKAFTLKTGLMVNEQGLIRGVTRSYPGREHDLTLFRRSRLLSCLPRTVVVIADKGFAGLSMDLPEHSLVTPFRASYKHPLTEEQHWANRDVARNRIIVENTICELKHFKVLADRFRQSAECLDAAFRAVIALVNARIACRLASA